MNVRYIRFKWNDKKGKRTMNEYTLGEHMFFSESYFMVNPVEVKIVKEPVIPKLLDGEKCVFAKIEWRGKYDNDWCSQEFIDRIFSSNCCVSKTFKSVSFKMVDGYAKNHFPFLSSLFAAKPQKGAV